MVPAQRVNIPLRSGVEQKTNEQLVIPNKMLDVKNLDFGQDDTLSRRRSLDAAGRLGSWPIRAWSMDDYVCVEEKDTALNLGSVVRKFSGSTNALFKNSMVADRYERVAATTEDIRSLPNTDQQTFDVAYHDGKYIVAFDNSSGFAISDQGVPSASTNSFITWEVRDPTGAVSGNTIRAAGNTFVGKVGSGGSITPASGFIAAVKPRCLVVNGAFHVVYAEVYLVSGTTYSYRVRAYNTTSGVTTTLLDMDPVTSATVTWPYISFDANVLQVDVGEAHVAATAAAPYLIGDTGSKVMRQVRWQVLGNVWSTAASDDFATVDEAAGKHMRVVIDNHRGFEKAWTFFVDDGDTKLYCYTEGEASADLVYTAPAQRALGKVLARSVGINNNFQVVVDMRRTANEYTARSQAVGNWNGASWTLTAGIASGGTIYSDFVELDSGWHFAVAFESRQFQSVAFLVNVTCPLFQPLIAASLSWGELSSRSVLPSYGFGYPHFSNSTFARRNGIRIPQTFSYNGKHYVPLVRYAENTRLLAGLNATRLNVALAEIDEFSQLGDADWQGTKLLCGADPLACDGVTVFEAGFRHNPEIGGLPSSGGLVELAPDASGDTSLELSYQFPEENKSYTFALTLAYTDARGNFHESGTAFHGRIVTETGKRFANARVFLPPTLKQAQLLLYRTLGNALDTTMYLCAVLGTVKANGEFERNLGEVYIYPNDGNLPSSEVLYTEGGVLPNTPIPPCRHVEAYQDRLVLSGCEDAQSLYFSKARAPGFAAEFTTDDLSHQQRATEKFGRIVATCEDSDRLIVFGTAAIGLIYGNGPDATGTQGGFQPLVSIVDDRGALWQSPKSVAKDNAGVWFHSPLGLRLIAGGQVARNQSGEVGAEVDDTVGSLTTSGHRIVTLPNGGDLSGMTRFALTHADRALHQASERSMLCFSQYWQQFTTYDNHACVDMAVYVGQYCLVSLANANPLYVVRKPTPNYASDENMVTSGGTRYNYQSTFRTAWLAMAEIQGFQRAKELLLLGRAPTDEGTDLVGQVLSYYDYSENNPVNLTYSITPVNNVLQLRHQLTRQKCEAVSFEVGFVDGGGAKPVTYLKLTALSLLVGAKGDFRKAQRK